MKAFSLTKKSVKQLAPVLALMAAVSLAGCDSRTAKSLCAEQSGPIEGITGIYNINSRDQTTFGVESHKVRIVPDGKGTARLVSESQKDDEEISIQICNVSGAYVMEAEDKKFGGFSHARMYVSQVGFHIVPLLFDKVALDAAQIPNKVIVIPAALRQLVGEAVSGTLERIATAVFDLEDQQTLYIDNANVPAPSLLRNAKPGSGSFTMFRE